MIRKYTIYSLTLVGFICANKGVFAQEKGGSIERPIEEVVISQDSSIVFEDGEVEHLSEPVSTPFNIPATELQKSKPSALIPNQEVIKNTPEGESKVRETKQEFSFNIIYYLIYKFKQVDN